MTEARGRRVQFRHLVKAALAAYALYAAPGALAQILPVDDRVNALQTEVRKLREDLETVKGNIAKIVQFLQQSQPAQADGQGARLNIAGAPVLGRADAPVTIIEFSDFECPFCQNFFASTLPKLKSEYIDTGKVRYVLMDFPLDRVHRKARKAAEAAHCSAEQGKFWQMHDLLFTQKGKFEIADFGGYAGKLGLSVPAFDACLASGRHASRIDQSMAGAVAIGIRVTPSFIVSLTAPGDIVSGGAIITGAQPYEEYRTAIEQALAAKP